MRFCKRCGTQLNDWSQFCPQCGEPVSRPQAGGPHGQASGPYGQTGGYPQGGFQQGYAAPRAARQSRTPFFIVLGAVAAVVIIVLMLVLRGCGGNTYTSPIETTLDVIISGRFDRASAQKILDQIPDPVMDMAFDMQQYGGEYFTESDLAALLADRLQNTAGSVASEYQASYEILDAEQMDREDIYELEDNYANMGVDMDISDAYTTEIGLYSTYDGDTDREFIDMITIRVNGRWYLDYTSFISIF